MPSPLTPTIEERLRRLPGAMLMAVGYYASLAPWPRRSR
jgi:hypothetical protein